MYFAPRMTFFQYTNRHAITRVGSYLPLEYLKSVCKIFFISLKNIFKYIQKSRDIKSSAKHHKAFCENFEWLQLFLQKRSVLNV